MSLGFSFLYGGRNLDECEFSKEVTASGDTVTTVLSFADGLTVTNIKTSYPEFDAVESVNYFENRGESNSAEISRLFDTDCLIPFPADEPYRYTAYLYESDTAFKIYAPEGSNLHGNEFFCDVDKLDGFSYPNWIYPGDIKKYAAKGGRSCDSHAPFFNLFRQGKGAVCAVGWTGQWNAEFERTQDGIVFRSGIEDTCFFLLPGEKIRTSSSVIMNYNGTVTEGQNKWRRLVREHFSVIGKDERGDRCPVWTSFWGGVSTASALKRLDKIKELGINYDCIWMDAGWYGTGAFDSPDEFEGDWWSYTGDWRVNTYLHPDGLADYSAKVHDLGAKLLLWFEPERAVKTKAPIYKEHPEYFYPTDASATDTLLDLGNDDARKYVLDTVCRLIDELHIDIYRQDFNIEPLAFWRRNDREGRRGISEIKHINGLYAFWDALLERYPHLIIDNCASGGKRIDIETLRRSVPLWHSDTGCPANCPSEISQQHTLTYGSWLPYYGAGVGRSYDLYNARSCYAPGTGNNFCYSERQSFGDCPGNNALIKKIVDEAKDIREYFEGDLYPLTEPSLLPDVWSAYQLDLPEKRKGLVMVFRRERAPYRECSFTLGNIRKDAEYTFTDADTGEVTVMSGEELANGYTVRIGEKRQSRLIRYAYTVDK